MNIKHAWSVDLTPEQVKKIRSTWHECMGNPARFGSGLFGMIKFESGKLRLMALQKEEVAVLRQALVRINEQTELDDLDKR